MQRIFLHKRHIPPQRHALTNFSIASCDETAGLHSIAGIISTLPGIQFFKKSVSAK
jgi:hypothetical protein